MFHTRPVCLFQEFLRRLPDCIFESENYEDLIATNNLQDREERVRQLKGYGLFLSALDPKYSIANHKINIRALGER